MKFPALVGGVHWALLSGGSFGLGKGSGREGAWPRGALNSLNTFNSLKTFNLLNSISLNSDAIYLVPSNSLVIEGNSSWPNEEGCY